MLDIYISYRRKEHKNVYHRTFTPKNIPVSLYIYIFGYLRYIRKKLCCENFTIERSKIIFLNKNFFWLINRWFFLRHPIHLYSFYTFHISSTCYQWKIQKYKQRNIFMTKIFQCPRWTKQYLSLHNFNYSLSEN